MTRLQNLTKAYRYGSCLQSSVATSLFEPGKGVLAPTNPEAFAAQKKRLTTFDLRGKITTAAKA